jgi:hypothetical protein
LLQAPEPEVALLESQLLICFLVDEYHPLGTFSIYSILSD